MDLHEQPNRGRRQGQGAGWGERTHLARRPCFAAAGR
eukprot:SAG31_NODE_45902_length_256_cov_4.382166_1_plen_36_part_10